jgi:uncharacterized phage protein gp47/JayE
MTYENGEVNPRSKDEWLEKLLEDGIEYWGEDIKDRDGTAIREFYEPFAAQLAELEAEVKAVVDALRINSATGEALDIKGEELGIFRLEATKAVGTVTFSRETAATKDYLIQQGTRVQTAGIDPITFETTEAATLTSGTTAVDVPVRALEAGASGNVAPNTITQMVTRPAGVESVTNANATTGGRDRETDEEYRARIKSTIGDIETASGYHITTKLTGKKFVRDVLFLENSEDTIVDSLPPHTIEVVVDADPGHENEIAQVIFENAPGGSDYESGIHGAATSGTATLPNGQTFTIPYSKPTEIQIYVDATVSVTESVNPDLIKDSIVNYIGGYRSNGSYDDGMLRAGDTVLYGEVEYYIRDVEGVYDVTSLTIGTSASPTGTSNISVNDSEIPTISATNINISVN